MLRFSLVFLLACTALFSDLNKSEQKLYKKGQKIYEHMCDSELLHAKNSTYEKQIKELLACGKLSQSNTKALLFYVEQKFVGKYELAKKELITVPHGAKCPVCGMFVHKYPKWAAEITLKNGEKKYFDGVKDMMKYIIFADEFGFHPDKISSAKVTNYYTLEAIDATKAYYVLGSNVFGPMGHELISFRTKKQAMSFLQEHFAKRIVRYKEIDPDLLNSLD